MKFFVHLMAFLFLATLTNAQQARSEESIVTPSFCAEEDLSNWLRTEEPYGTQGIFGQDYSRILMHFGTVRRDAANPCLYHITGASRHKGTVTPFIGTILIDEVRILDARASAADEGGQDLGFKASYRLREDSTQKYSGVFWGGLTFQLHRFADRTLLDKQLAAQGARYRNFTYEGKFRFHNSGKARPASWGRGRLSVPEGLDVGKDRFQVSPEHGHSGWERNQDGTYKEDKERWWEGK